MLTVRVRKIECQTLLPSVDTEIIGIHPFFTQHVLTDHPVWVPINRVFKTDNIHTILGESVREIGYDRCLLQGQHGYVFKKVHMSLLGIGLECRKIRGCLCLVGFVTQLFTVYCIH